MSDFEPTDVFNLSKRAVSESFGPELAESTAIPTPTPKPEREGLPVGYRMRAEPHYVEQLSARRADRIERERPQESVRSAVTEIDRSAPHTREQRGDRVLGQLQEELATLATATAMLTQASPLARRLGTDLVRAQAWKASWLLKAHALVEGRDRAQIRPQAVGPLIEQLRQGLLAECRLSGVSLLWSASDWNATVAGDDTVLSAGVTGAVVATLGVMGQPESGGTVRVNIETAGGELRAIDVVQDEYSVPAGMSQRCFDLGWTDRPGGWLAALGAVTAKLAAQQHGGTALLQAGERRGTVLRISLATRHH